MSKRVMIAGTGSGCGKTTITCALLSALVSMGNDVIAFKCGPDYIDPMFHKKAAGLESRNLDIFLMGEQGVRYCAARHAANGKIAVLEGVMGFYDGLGNGSYASSNHVSLLTNTPVVLIVSAKGTSLSICAEIKGFLEFERNNIRGLILNNVSEAIYPFYKRMIEERLNISVIGFMPHIPDVHLESRHLGLVTADEIADIKEKLNILGDYAVRCVDLEALQNIAGQAEPFDSGQNFLPAIKNDCSIKIYVARDEAFCFCYEDNNDLFKWMGAEIEFFSPIHDRELPNDAAGIVLWGGYPELYARALEENTSMRYSLKSAIEADLPVYAECGGFRYLQQSLTDLDGKTYEMLGVLPGNAKMTKKLRNFGYYEIEAQRDNLLCRAGGKINAHFFHHSVSNCEGDCFMAVKNSGVSFPCIAAKMNILAGCQHLHFWGNPDFALNFINTCVEYYTPHKRSG